MNPWAKLHSAIPLSCLRCENKPPWQKHTHHLLFAFTAEAVSSEMSFISYSEDEKYPTIPWHSVAPCLHGSNNLCLTWRFRWQCGGCGGRIECQQSVSLLHCRHIVFGRWGGNGEGECADAQSASVAVCWFCVMNYNHRRRGLEDVATRVRFKHFSQDMFSYSNAPLVIYLAAPNMLSGKIKIIYLSPNHTHVFCPRQIIARNVLRSLAFYISLTTM